MGTSTGTGRATATGARAGIGKATGSGSDLGKLVVLVLGGNSAIPWRQQQYYCLTKCLPVGLILYA